MAGHLVFFWKQIPLFRLLVPFIGGIIGQWYVGFSLPQLGLALAVLVAAVVFFQLLPDDIKFSKGWMQGIALMLAFCTAGALVAYHHDIRNKKNWIGHNYSPGQPVLVTVTEPLVEKNKSYKATASAQAIWMNDQWQLVEGNVLLYFKKDSTAPALDYGTQIILSKSLQPITNSGNPGSFDFQRYSAFHDTYHQCYLKHQDYVVTGTNNGNRIQQWLFALRFSVIESLRKHIDGPQEQGVAEALLIGYRNDLDKSLVQAYSNTGVVHVIAISGLHLGIIYGLLLSIFKLFKKYKGIKPIRFVVILAVLWIFALVAGAAPSIVRSAVMFSCIVIGEAMGKRTNIFSSLATSALLILFFNPFSLWDVGFQLSYAAVLSIVLFMKPIYHWLYIRNKFLDWFWQLNAVTLSAQLLTLPIICYHFHQFPNLFLLTNCVVVPIAGLLLGAELLIVFMDQLFVPVAAFFGTLTTYTLWFINTFVQQVNSLPFVVSGGIQISFLQAALLYGMLAFGGYWLMRKSRLAFNSAVVCTSLFIFLRTIDFAEKSRQQKMIVYNIPQHTAIDFVSGRNYRFAGDTAVLDDAFLENFHLKPSRILNRLHLQPESDVAAAYPFYLVNNRKILLVDKPFRFTAANRVQVDAIILSKNPPVKIEALHKAFDCSLYVFDGSNALWKISNWKKECDSLHLRHYSTQENGALQLSW